MKILQISVGESLRGGGIGRIASNLAQKFYELGIDSVLASCYAYDMDKDYTFRKIDCIKLPFFSSVVIPLNLKKIIKEEKPDVIISHGYSSSLPLFSYNLAKKLKINHIFAVHSYPVETGFRRVAMKIYDFLAKEALNNSKLIYFSRSSKDILKKKGKIVRFVPEDIFFNVKKKKRNYLLFVGRLDENKRPEWFVEICSLLNMKGVIAGIDEGRKKSLLKLINELNADVVVKEVPFSEMPSIYSKAYALVTTSKYEGLPLVWLEAIATSTPIFTTDVGDARVLLNEFYGTEDFIFNSVEEAKKLILSKSEDELNELSKKAKLLLEKERSLKNVKNILEYIREK